MVIVPKQKRLTSYHFMDNENEQPQVEGETPVVEETTEEQSDELIPQEDTVILSKADYNKLNRKAIAYDTVKKSPQVVKVDSSIDSIDQIKLGKKLHDYSDDELDFVTEHAKSKKPEDVLKALENPFVQAGIKAHRESLEKEKLALKPNGTQSELDKPRSLAERLANASIGEKEGILKDMGLYKEFRPRADKTNIGSQGLR